MAGDVKIRTEKEADFAEIARVHDEAFQRTAEAALVEKIRKSDTYIPELSFVAVDGDKIVGHVLFSIVEIDCGGGSKKKVLALAPLAVHPAHQRHGVGSKLTRHGIDRARALGWDAIIVLGQPSYYPRFGFRQAYDFAIESPFPLNDPGAFMVLELKEDALSECSGLVVYPDFFMELDEGEKVRPSRWSRWSTS